jgi:hypothetical protein
VGPFNYAPERDVVFQLDLLSQQADAQFERGDYQGWRKVQFDRSVHSELDQVMRAGRREKNTNTRFKKAQ